MGPSGLHRLISRHDSTSVSVFRDNHQQRLEWEPEETTTAWVPHHDHRTTPVPVQLFVQKAPSNNIISSTTLRPASTIEQHQMHFPVVQDRLVGRRRLDGQLRASSKGLITPQVSAEMGGRLEDVLLEVFILQSAEKLGFLIKSSCPAPQVSRL
jgi:hypothetical protein